MDSSGSEVKVYHTRSVDNLFEVKVYYKRHVDNSSPEVKVYYKRSVDNSSSEVTVLITALCSSDEVLFYCNL